MGKGAPDEAGTALPSGKPVHLMKCEKYPKKTSVKPAVSDIVQLRLPLENYLVQLCRHVSSVDSVYTYGSLLYLIIYILYRIIYICIIPYWRHVWKSMFMTSKEASVPHRFGAEEDSTMMYNVPSGKRLHNYGKSPCY